MLSVHKYVIKLNPNCYYCVLVTCMHSVFNSLYIGLVLSVSSSRVIIECFCPFSYHHSNVFQRLTQAVSHDNQVHVT